MVTVQGTRIVRIRRITSDIGLGYRIAMFRVTDPGGRARVGTHDHLSREAAARWITAQGWRYIGSQE